MNAIANRPENRRRDGLNDLASAVVAGAQSACYRSEAFAEDLGDAVSVAPGGAPGAQPSSGRSRWRAVNPLPLLGFARVGMQGVLGR